MPAIVRSKVRPAKDAHHEYADGHKVAHAIAEHASKRRLRDVADLQSSGEVAAQRIREFAYDLGAEVHHARGWKAHAARKMGLTYGTAWAVIMMGRSKTKHVQRKATVSTATVDKIARATGCPVSVFYDPEI